MSKKLNPIEKMEKVIIGEIGFNHVFRYACKHVLDDFTEEYGHIYRCNYPDEENWVCHLKHCPLFKRIQNTFKDR